MNINLKGAEQLSDDEKKEFDRILSSAYEKLKRKTKADFNLKVVVKVYSKSSSDNEEKRKKYSIQADISGNMQNFEADSWDWDLNKALHKVFEKLENEVEHRFHSSEQNKNSWKK